MAAAKKADAKKKNNTDRLLNEYEREILGENSPPIGPPPPYMNESIRPPTTQRGLVLVWDLDATLVSDALFKILDPQHNTPPENLRDTAARGYTIRDTAERRYTLQDTAEISYINKAALDLIDLAVKKKREDPGKVDAILLLTNNSDDTYVKIVVEAIKHIIGAVPFNLIWTYNNPERKRQTVVTLSGRLAETKRKALEDVDYMLKKLNINTDNLEHRVYFFDDQEYHILAYELNRLYPPNHGTFIKIDPPFTGNHVDYTTLFEPVVAVLNDSTKEANAGGGGGAKGGARSLRRKRKLTRKSKYRKRLTKRRR